MACSAKSRGLRQLVALSRNPRLIELYDDISKELHLFRRHGLETASARQVSNSQHREIVDCLRARDADKAAHLMEAHILAGKSRMPAARRH